MKKFLARWWRLILAAALTAAAAAVLYFGCVKTEMEFRSKQDSLGIEIAGLQSQIELNQQYADIQDQLPAANQAIQDSRAALYRHFPADLLEEDQIMYVLYLEQVFGTEITFSFGSVEPLSVLEDSSIVGGVTLTVNYETTYQGFKDMINYLATDSRITSIQYCTLEYDDATDTAKGFLTLLCYTLNATPYKGPDVPKPNTGKPDIFD